MSLLLLTFFSMFLPREHELARVKMRKFQNEMIKQEQPPNIPQARFIYNYKNQEPHGLPKKLMQLVF
jgi:hypothetical protein